MKLLMKRLWREEEGQDLTEYALLLVLLVLAANRFSECLSDSDQQRVLDSCHEPERHLAGPSRRLSAKALRCEA